MTATVLLTIVTYYSGFDTGYRDYKHLYQAWTQITRGNEKREPSEATFGVLSQAINEDAGDLVESSTVITDFHRGGYFTMDGENVDAGAIGADSLFFTTMGVEVLQGNPLKDLARPGTAFISTDFIKSHFPDGNPIGRRMKFFFDALDVEIVGVYKSMPSNTSTEFDIVLSMPTVYMLGDRYIGHGWNDIMSWRTFMRLKKGTDTEILDRRLNAIMQKNRPEANGTSFEVMARPIHQISKYDRMLVTILLSVALTVLFIAILNYSLLSISSLSKRAKMIGVHKCNGAGKGTIFSMFMTETTLIVLMSLIVTVAGAMIITPLLTDILYDDAFDKTPWAQRLTIAAMAVVTTIVIGGVIPARIFAKLPVAHVFRRFRDRNSAWKRILLFVEFAGVAFVSAWLMTTTAQYIYITTADRGYTIDDKALFIYKTYRESRMDEIMNITRNLPYVESIAYSAFAPMWGSVGDEISDDAGNALFQANYNVMSENYVSAMGMRLLQGRVPCTPDEAIVNRKFIEMMKWDEKDLLSKNPNLMVNVGRDEYKYRRRIVGVIDNYLNETFRSETKPLIMWYSPEIMPYITINLKEPFKQNYNKLQSELNEHYTADDYELYTYRQTIDEQAEIDRAVRNIFLAVMIIIAIITLMGLTGFLRDEMQRRSKEIAIRKISGASASQITLMITSGLMWIAIPSVALGSVAAWYISDLWFGAFRSTVAFLPLYFVLSALIVLSLILLCAVKMTRHKAYENPSLNLVSE